MYRSSIEDEKSFESYDESFDGESQSLSTICATVSECKLLGSCELLSDKLLRFNRWKNEKHIRNKEPPFNSNNLENFLVYNYTSSDGSPFSLVKTSPYFEKSCPSTSLSPFFKEDSRATRTPSKMTYNSSKNEEGKERFDFVIGMDNIEEIVTHKQASLQSESKEPIKPALNSDLDIITIDDMISIEPQQFKKNTFSINESSKAKRMKLRQKFISSVLKGNYDELIPNLPFITKAFLDEAEENGYTAFQLFVKTAKKARDYIFLLKCFLELAPTLTKNGISCIQEALSNKDYESLSIIFDHSLRIKSLQVREERLCLKGILKRLPDFYMEMKWEFDSFLIPFLTKLAPSDTFRIWKVGESIRLDFNLIGFRGIKAKRRETSLIFNSNGLPDLDRVSQYNDEEEMELGLWTLSHRHKYFTNPMQKLDNLEREKVLEDLKSSIELHTKLHLNDVTIKKSKNWKGNPIYSVINGWKTIKFELEKKKKKDIEVNKLLEEYDINNTNNKFQSRKELDLNIETLKAMDTIPKNHESSRNSINFKSRSLIPDGSFKARNKINNSEIRAVAANEPKEKKASLQMWLTKEFPISFWDFSQLLSFLANGNEMLQTMGQFIQKENLKEVFKEWGFPVRIQVPMNKLIRGNVLFSNFKFLKSFDSKYLPNFMAIPSDYSYQNRRIAYKTLERRKKRMILTNLLSV